MDTINNTTQKLHINVTAINNTATIFLSGTFSFDAHREFKAAYSNLLNNSKIGNIVVNLAAVEYLDSSALGMLLVMRDHVQAANKSLTLSSPSPIAVRTFEIASFDKVFTIN
jgi:anti-anti-sigma factor